MKKEEKEVLLTNLCAMCYKYFPIEFSSYEDYIKYLKEKGLALEAPDGMYNNKEERQ